MRWYCVNLDWCQMGGRRIVGRSTKHNTKRWTKTLQVQRPKSGVTTLNFFSKEVSLQNLLSKLTIFDSAFIVTKVLCTGFIYSKITLTIRNLYAIYKLYRICLIQKHNFDIFECYVQHLKLEIRTYFYTCICFIYKYVNKD